MQVRWPAPRHGAFHSSETRAALWPHDYGTPEKRKLQLGRYHPGGEECCRRILVGHLVRVFLTVSYVWAADCACFLFNFVGLNRSTLCVEYLPNVNKVAKQYKDKGLIVVGLTRSSDKVRKAQKMCEIVLTLGLFRKRSTG